MAKHVSTAGHARPPQSSTAERPRGAARGMGIALPTSWAHGRPPTSKGRTHGPGAWNRVTNLRLLIFTQAVCLGSSVFGIVRSIHVVYAPTSMVTKWEMLPGIVSGIVYAVYIHQHRHHHEPIHFHGDQLVTGQMGHLVPSVPHLLVHGLSHRPW